MHNLMSSRIDYNDYSSGKLHSEREANLNIQTGSLNDSEFNRIKNLYQDQKFRVEYANKAIKNRKVNTLNFPANNGLGNLAKKLTNPIQINDYNHLRRAHTSMYFPNNKKQDYFATKSYNLQNELLVTTKPHKKQQLRVHKRECKPNQDCYTSADETIYKHYTGPNRSRIEEVDYPTKNVIHVPGKYHELYRQSATFDEIPQNLKHKFRAQSTSELLKDEIKVHDTLAKIYNVGVNKKFDHQVDEKKEIDTIARASTAVDKYRDYNDLGHLLRHTVAHGNPTVYHTGLKEEVHNDEVSKLYLSDQKNIDSPYRRKTDWLIKWTEARFIREGIYTKFDAANAERIAERAKTAAV